MEKNSIEQLFDECYEISSKGLGSSYGLGIEKVSGGYEVKIYPHHAIGTNLVDALIELRKNLLGKANQEIKAELARTEKFLKSYQENIHDCNEKFETLNKLKEKFIVAG